MVPQQRRRARWKTGTRTSQLSAKPMATGRTISRSSFPSRNSEGSWLSLSALFRLEYYVAKGALICKWLRFTEKIEGELMIVVWSIRCVGKHPFWQWHTPAPPPTLPLQIGLPSNNFDYTYSNQTGSFSLLVLLTAPCPPYSVLLSFLTQCVFNVEVS